MGLYFTVTAGPVLICKLRTKEVTETKTKKKAHCSNHKDHKIGGNSPKFCPLCGAAVVVTEETKEIRKTVKFPEWNQIFELMGEGGFREDTFENCWGGLNCERLVDDCDVLAPDTEDYLGRKGNFEANEFDINVRNPDVKAEIARCEEFYAKEIAYLRTLYESVVVEWMVLTSGS